MVKAPFSAHFSLLLDGFQLLFAGSQLFRTQRLATPRNRQGTAHVSRETVPWLPTSQAKANVISSIPKMHQNARMAWNWFSQIKKNMIAYLCISHITLFSCSRFVLMNDLLLPIEIIVSPWLSIPQHENPRPKPRPPSHVCAMDGGA